MQTYKVETEDLAEKVYKNIKQMILKRQLVPGQKLTQEEMARVLGVSRTPLLSAFSKLEKEWLVESRPRRGYYIRELSREDELNLFDIRLRLEPLGAGKAALHGSPQEKKRLLMLIEDVPDFNCADSRKLFNDLDYHFHGQVMAMSRNSMLEMMLSSYNIISLSNQDEIHIDCEKSMEGHRAIADAIARGDQDAAEEAMRQHIEIGRNRIFEQRHL
ncbi:GntR family transcriptional regulator [Oceanispirochaeta sp.]|jgi:DNA-binding GntR family transcriptional regulator|uniref:GntR family transcriptional regulator n=1 Tax=Oceanispirochaeta sp. TaxID=2035350 RepID=UPI00262E08F3|nr:GntR family transcriptional regulator [Oceanispirochaeta sp.]MDA3956081.1 GntR family transcriptional regulator [Oceanispirochaeta sp.]